MTLHENKKLFKQAVQFTSDQMNMLPIYVEKDYEEEVYATLTKIKSRLSDLKWAGIINLQTSAFDIQ